MSGHEIELAQGVGIGDSPPKKFDRKYNRSEGIVQLMNDIADVE